MPIELHPTSAADATGGTGFILVPAPFPHIAAHIMNSEFVGLLLPHGMRAAVRVFFVPSDLVGVVASAELVSLTQSASARRPLPFHLGRQAVAIRCGVHLDQR